MGNSASEHYRYKLNENWGRGDSACLEAVHLSKKKWNISDRKLLELEKHIRTKNNSKGLVDFESFIPAQQIVIKSSKKIFEKKPSKYTRDEIGTMSRPELVEIAELYGIDCVRKKADYLREKIIENQREYLKKITESVSKKPKKNDKKVIDKTLEKEEEKKENIAQPPMSVADLNDKENENFTS